LVVEAAGIVDPRCPCIFATYALFRLQVPVTIFVMPTPEESKSFFYGCKISPELGDHQQNRGYRHARNKIIHLLPLFPRIGVVEFLGLPVAGQAGWNRLSS
jgi:hypothetical protein